MKRPLYLSFGFNKDRNVKDFFPQGTSIPDPPNFRTEVDEVLLKCDDNKDLIDRTEFWNSSNELVRAGLIIPGTDIKFSEFQKFSAFATLQEILCAKPYGGLGIRLAQDNGSTKVSQVFDGSPADRAGLKVNDIITHIDNEPLNNLTPQEILELSRGPANTKVVLTILRNGENKPIELTITRENIQPQSSQLESPR